MDLASLAALVATLLGLIAPIESGYTWVSGGAGKGWPGAPPPEFEPTPQSIIVLPGQTALLPCRVRNLADKVVSWIRRKDLHIISSGRFVFTGDSRFQVVHPDGDSSAWGLQLRAAQPKDQGLYECQINTDPKMKRSILLTVTDGSESAVIPGPRERYVRARSSLALGCQLKLTKTQFPKMPRPQSPLVQWLHDNNPISIRSGVKVETQKEEGEVVSHLTLGAVDQADSGVYTCRPFIGRPATVTLYVIEGEHSEAMQGDFLSGASLVYNFGLLAFLSPLIHLLV